MATRDKRGSGDNSKSSNEYNEDWEFKPTPKTDPAYWQSWMSLLPPALQAQLGGGMLGGITGGVPSYTQGAAGNWQQGAWQGDPLAGGSFTPGSYTPPEFAFSAPPPRNPQVGGPGGAPDPAVDGTSAPKSNRGSSRDRYRPSRWLQSHPSAARYY